MPVLTGGEAIVRMLWVHGVDLCLGMGGYQPLPYYDALARQSDIRHILIRDEKHGAFAADAYARVKNRPAVADATLGPGATNLVSGAAESYGASIPLILLTAEVNGLIATRGATQESDQRGMLAPTSRLTVELDRIERIPELVRRAVSVANGGRPGPVHLNVREEVFHGEHDFADDELYADPGSTLACGRRPRPDPQLVDRAAVVLAAAERPVLLAGGGIHLSGAYAEVERIAELMGMPVVTTISGKGSLSEAHPLAAGIVGRYSRFGNDLVKAADVLLVVGCKLGEIATSRWSLLRPGTTIVHVDIDAAEPGRVYRTDIGIWSDAGLGLADLAAALGDGAEPSARRARLEAVDTARAAWRAEAGPRYASGEIPIAMPRVVAELQRALPPESIVVADGGFAAHWSGLLYDVTAAGRHYIANRGHAAIGYGLPGAIGAKLAAPDLPVVALCGDNGFAMAVAELETAKRERTPLVALVVNNGTLGYVKALQHGMYDGRYQSVDFLDVDYGAVARAFGCEGRRVERPDDLAGALAEALASDVPYVLDVLITVDPGEMLPGVDARTVRASR